MNQWKLIWNDEFDGPVGSLPDPQKWRYDLGGEGWGNQEWEYYTDRPQNASLDGKGALMIQALETSKQPEASINCWYGACKYTSARLLTRGVFEFTYGKVEARLQMPYGQGVWPAFWMLGSNIDSVSWPVSGEIDIMENIGREPSTIHGTIHGPGYSGADGIGKDYTLASGAFKDDFHVFAVEWEPEAIRWYVDGEQYFQVTPKSLPAGRKWVYDHPFFLLVNLAIGGYWPGYPDETTTFPQQFLVDYVRVYQAEVK